MSLIVGGFYGDEGKGKIISHLAVRDDPKVIVRGGAGPNAGHTIRDCGKTYKVRMLPSGFLNRDAKLLIGPGVVVNPDVFLGEVAELGAEGRAFVDRNAGIITGEHLGRDSGDLQTRIGSTGSGTGPANADRAMRILGVAGDEERLSGHIADVPKAVNDAIDAGDGVLIEGTQGTFLSLWHGTYPYVTSKDVTASGICADVGVGPTKIRQVIVVFKAYVTRVGTGPLDGELPDEETQRRGWGEFGTVTGRARRAAAFDMNLAKRAVMLNGATQIAITKLDVAYPDCRGATSISELGGDAKSFIKNIQDSLDVRVTLLGTGPDAKDIIDLRTV